MKPKPIKLYVIRNASNDYIEKIYTNKDNATKYLFGLGLSRRKEIYYIEKGKDTIREINSNRYMYIIETFAERELLISESNKKVEWG